MLGELFFGHQFGFMKNNHDHNAWMATLEALFPFIATSAVLPKYLRGAFSLAGLFSSSIRKGIPGMTTMVKASVACVAERQGQLERGEPTRRDILAKAFDIYEADLHDEKKSNSQKMLLEDVQTEALTAM